MQKPTEKPLKEMDGFTADGDECIAEYTLCDGKELKKSSLHGSKQDACVYINIQET